jgi:hypothetical protein
MAKKKTSLVVYVVAAAVLWWLFWDETKAPTASVSLGDPTIVTSDPSAQLPGDYTTSDRSNMALMDDVVPQ